MITLSEVEEEVNEGLKNHTRDTLGSRRSALGCKIKALEFARFWSLDTLLCFTLGFYTLN